MMGTIQVLPPGLGTTTTVTSSSIAINLNGSVTFTAAVVPTTAGGPAPSGTVQFSVDGAIAGSPVAISAGQAALTTTLTTSGNHLVTALYSGDVNYSGSVSSTLGIAVEDFTLTATSAAIPAPGQSGNSTITITGSTNFTDPINFTCSLPNSMSESACFVNPASITGSGQVTLTVNTTPPHALVQPHVDFPPFGKVRGMAFGFVTLLLAISMLAVPRRRWRMPAMLSLVVLAVLSFAVGCGGGGGKTDPGTPSGTYNVVVTGTSGTGTSQIQHTVVATFTVQ